MQHYVYKITNKTTGEYYYGKRTAFNWETDPYMGSGLMLKNKMEAHPDHEWVKEVLLLLDSAEEAYLYEKIIIGDKWRDDPLCLNLVAGGVGSGLTREDMIQRKERRLIWDSKGELPDTKLIKMCNDNLGINTRLTNGPKAPDMVKSLIENGFDFGSCNSYEWVGLADLGIEKTPVSKKEVLEMVREGRFPDVLTLNLKNDELRLYTQLSNQGGDKPALVLDLINQGWEPGCNLSYKYIKGSEVAKLKTASSCRNEERFLKGLPPVTTKISMSSPCGVKYVVLSINTGKWTDTVKHLYELGWTFGATPLTQTKVSPKDYIGRMKPV